MKEQIKHTVIIWGTDDFNTLGLLRQLNRPEINLFFLIRGAHSYASQSKYCTKSHSTRSLDEGLHYLLETFSKEKNRPIIIASGDGVITYIDQNRSALESYFILPGTIQTGLIEKYIDKNNMTELAETHGFLCPVSQFVRWNSNISDVKYPCIIKPSHEQPGLYNEFKYRICRNAKELKKVLSNVRKSSEFILQQYIEKEQDLLVYGARLRNGETILAGAFIRDRFADSGSSSHGYFTNKIPLGANVDGIIGILSSIDFYGPFSFEYGMIGEKAYFFEVNLRNDGTSHYFYQAGANIPLAYVYSCIGKDYSSISTTIKSYAQYFIDEEFDIENVLHKRISYKKYKLDKAQATIFKYYDREDDMPWRYVHKTRYIQIVKDILLKKYRIYIVRILEKFGLRK